MMGRIGTYPAIAPKKPVVHVGMKTPWGKAQTARVLAEGVGEVTTAGHGGIKLDRTRNARIPYLFRKDGGWYEEDCEAFIPIMFLGLKDDGGIALTQEAIEDARAVLKNYYPTAYEGHFNVKVTAAESYVVREREAKEAAKGKMHIIACWGDWSRNVPKGRVGVLATKDGVRGDKTAERYYTITDEQYKAGGLPVRVLPDDAVYVPLDPMGLCPFGPE